jgi:hypothetical protein
LSSPLSATATLEPVRSSILGRCRNDWNLPALNEQSFPVNRGIGDLFVGGLENPADSLARNAHFFGSVSLIKPLQIGQTDCLKLIDSQRNLFQH